MESLTELQQLIHEAELRKGHDSDDVVYKCFLLMEEMGELTKALRVFLGMKVHSKTARYNLEDEFGDVLFLIGAIANRVGVELSPALINKIAKDEEKLYMASKIGDEQA